MIVYNILGLLAILKSCHQQVFLVIYYSGTEFIGETTFSNLFGGCILAYSVIGLVRIYCVLALAQQRRKQQQLFLITKPTIVKAKLLNENKQASICR